MYRYMYMLNIVHCFMYECLCDNHLSDGVRLGLSLSLPLSVDDGVGISNHRVVDSSVREASYSSNTRIADTSDNTTSSAASQHLSDGVGIRLAADGYSQEHLGRERLGRRLNKSGFLQL